MGARDFMIMIRKNPSKHDVRFETLPNGFLIFQRANLPSQNKDTISEQQNNTLDQKPSRIVKLQWQAISENQRYAHIE